MFRRSLLLIGRFIRGAASALLRLAQLMERVNGSTLVQRGVDRNLYRTRFNDFFWLNTTSYIDQLIIKEGIFEPESTNIVRKIVKDGDFTIDVGGNIGYYTVILSKLVGNSGKVICFEPTVFYGKVLSANLEANNIQNVNFHNFGLSDKTQKLQIEIGDSSATIHSFGKKQLNFTEKIHLVTLDDFMEKNPLPRIDFIKLDIDGHEPLFLEGARKTIEKYNPIILMEISHLHYLEAGFTAWDFYDSLVKKGFIIYSEHGLERIKSKVEFLIKCGNFAFSSNIIISKTPLT